MNGLQFKRFSVNAYYTHNLQVVAEVSVNVPGANWKLSVNNPEIDAAKKMRDGLIALIVVAAFILSGAYSLCLLCRW